MDDHLLFPEARQVLEEACRRHRAPLAYALEGIDLAHLAYGRERDFAASFVPGVPRPTRVRNDVNDESWRFYRAVAEPLVQDGLIQRFDTIDGGDVVVLPDGLCARLKKGNPDGSTSNYPTFKVLNLGTNANRALFTGATPLDEVIQDGVWFDIVFVAGESLGTYTQVGLRFACTDASPFVIIDPPTASELRGISPVAFDLLKAARARLAG